MFRRSILIFGAVAVLATAILTWAIADVVYDISLPRCVSGRRSVSCGGDTGWHGTSSLISALLAVPALFTLAGAYLWPASRLVRAAKPRNRDALRRSLRSRFALTLLTAVALTLPATLLLRSAL